MKKSILLLVFALSASQVQAQELSPGVSASIAATIAGNVADFVTTKQAFDRGAVEGNGLIAGQPIKTLAVGKILFTAGVVSFEILAARHGHTRIAKVLGFVDGGATFIVAAHNARTAR